MADARTVAARMGDAGTEDARAGGGLFVSWQPHGRSRDLAGQLGMDLLECPPRWRRRPAPVRYAVMSVLTARAVLRRRGRPVVSMAPPIVAGAVVAAMATIARSPVAVDAHSGTFNDPRWRWSHPLVRWCVRRAAVTLVTNAAHQRLVAAWGGTGLVVHDPIERVEPVDEVASGPAVAPAPPDAESAASLRRESAGSLAGAVVVPLTYAPDEPLDAVLEAAGRLAGTAVLALTGAPPPELLARERPGNVVFTGFLDDDAYRRLVASAGVVLALTTRPDTMQRGAYEALSHGRAVVTSDSEVLRAFFGDAALYARPEPASIATAVEEAVARADELAGAVRRLAERRRAEGLAAVASVREALQPCPA